MKAVPDEPTICSQGQGCYPFSGIPPARIQKPCSSTRYSLHPGTSKLCKAVGRPPSPTSTPCRACFWLITTGGLYHSCCLVPMYPGFEMLRLAGIFVAGIFHSLGLLSIKKGLRLSCMCAHRLVISSNELNLAMPFFTTTVVLGCEVVVCSFQTRRVCFHSIHIFTALKCYTIPQEAVPRLSPSVPCDPEAHPFSSAHHHMCK
jgi:hypothetical protein